VLEIKKKSGLSKTKTELGKEHRFMNRKKKPRPKSESFVNPKAKRRSRKVLRPSNFSQSDWEVGGFCRGFLNNLYSSFESEPANRSLSCIGEEVCDLLFLPSEAYLAKAEVHEVIRVFKSYIEDLNKVKWVSILSVILTDLKFNFKPYELDDIEYTKSRRVLMPEGSQREVVKLCERLGIDFFDALRFNRKIKIEPVRWKNYE
jgi:hypothetical protein